MKLYLQILLTALLFLACSKENRDTKIWIVADYQADCMGAGPQKCLLVKEQEADSWQFLYSGIEGFEYEEGFTYRIEVKIYEVARPPADGSSKRFVLKRIISKQ